MTVLNPWKIRRRRLWALVASALLLAITGCEEDKGPGSMTIRDADGYRLEVDSKPFSLRLVDPDGETRITVEPGGLGIGRVAVWSRTQNYDPYFQVFDFLNGPHEPDDLTWVSVASVISHREEGDLHLIDVRLSDETAATLQISTPRAGAFRLFLDVPGAVDEVHGEPGVVFTYLDVVAPEGENFYGLGQVFHSVAHRGQSVAMQMELTEHEAANNEAHVRIPLLVSSGSWGVFGNSMRPSYFDVAQSDSGRVRAVFGDPAMDLYLLASPEPLAITEHYTALTSQPSIPPIWAFAPIQWRNEIAGQDEVLLDASDIRLHGVPTGAIWIDRPYQSGYNTMAFDATRYPDPDAMVATLHDQGFRLAGWNAPYLEDTDPDYDMAEANGYFAEGTFPFQSFGKFLDLTHPDCMAFWQARVAAAYDRGIEGWKLDYAEDIQLGVSDARMLFSFYSGEDERTMNRRYAEYYHRAYAEPLGLPEVFTIVRSATIGGQKYASVIWPGDLCSDFKEFGDEGEDGKIHVGGLPSAVRAGIGLSVSGYPFFASDIGGFRHNRPTHEVMVRWTEAAALLPVMQYGGGGDNHNPWDFTAEGESQFTQDTLDIFKVYATLHIRLFPYFYSHARRAHTTGRPVIRPFGLAYPDDGRHPDLTFLSGPDLLVAPVVEQATQRSVPVPAGTWIDWWTDQEVEGPTDVTRDAPLETLPLYLRAGAIVPMLRPTVMTLSPVTDLTVDSYDTDPGRLWGRVVPESGAENTFTLHDDTELGVEGFEDETADFWYQPGSAYTGLRIRVYVPDVTQVRLDGAELTEAATEGDLESCQACWYRDGQDPWIWIGLDPQSSARHSFELR